MFFNCCDMLKFMMVGFCMVGVSLFFFVQLIDLVYVVYEVVSVYDFWILIIWDVFVEGFDSVVCCLYGLLFDGFCGILFCNGLGCFS